MKSDNLHIDIIISKTFANEASESELEILDNWLSSSEENRKHFFSLKNIWDISHPTFVSTDIDTDNALNKVLPKVHKPTRINLLKRYQQIASIILLPIVIAFGYYYFSSSNSEISSHEVFTQYGTRTSLMLTDGSKVCLNAGSTLIYPDKFKDNSRNVSLSGEAYFEVESSKAKPFSVQAKNLVITATGTAFNINSYKSDSISAISLDHGVLSVTTEDGEKITLSAGETLLYNNNTKQYAVNNASSRKLTSWKEGILIFRDDSLEYVFKRLEQMYNVKFVFKDSKIKQYKYRATFKNESLEEILYLLRLSAPIEYDMVSSNSEDISSAKRIIEIYQVGQLQSSVK